MIKVMPSNEIFNHNLLQNHWLVETQDNLHWFGIEPVAQDMKIAY